MKNCRVCNIELTDENWMPSLKNRGSIICRECNNSKGREWRKINKDKTLQYSRKRYQENKKRYINSTTNHRRKLRVETIFEYGGKCANCGIDDIDVLDLDHIYNDGAEDRKKNLFAYNLYREKKRKVTQKIGIKCYAKIVIGKKN